MTLQEKLGALYARCDCGSRSCGNCAIENICRSDISNIKLIQEIQTEVKALIKERDELLKEAQAK